LNIDQEQPTFGEYLSKDDEEQSFSMVPVYDNYGSDPWESHEGEKEELNVQLISCLEPVYEKISPGIGQPASLLYPPVHSMNIKRQVSNNERKEVIYDQLSMHDYKFYDLVGLYIELSFPKSLEPAHVNVLNLHKIDLARKYYTHLQREIKKEEARQKEWKNSH
jgi:hypothetical protein